MKNILLTGFLFQFIFSTTAQDVPDKYNDLLTRINEEFGKEVQEELAALREKNPNDPWVFWLSGLSSSQEEAVGYFKKSVEVDSTFASGYYNWASELDKTTNDNVDLAIELYTKSLKYNPKDYYAFTFRGHMYFQQGKYDLALADYKKGVKYSEGNLSAADELYINILNAQNRKTELYDFMKKRDFANNLGFGDPDYFFLLGTIYTEMKQSDNACTCYLSAQEMFEAFGAELPEKLTEALSKCE